MKEYYFTEEERSRPYEHFSEGYEFKAARKDLKDGIDIYPSHYAREADLVTAVMCFTSYWQFVVWPHLNGFSGLDTVPVRIHYDDGRIVERKF